MRRALSALVGGAVAFGATAAQAQQKIPVVELSAPSAKSTETVGGILGLDWLQTGPRPANHSARHADQAREPATERRQRRCRGLRLLEHPRAFARR